VSIERGIIDPNGQPALPATPTVTYRWEQTRVTGRWRSTLTVLNLTGPVVGDADGRPMQLENPFAVSRIENDGDGTPDRIYDRRGNLLPPLRSPARGPATALTASLPDHLSRPPGLTPQPRSNDGTRLFATLIAAATDKGVRRAALVRAYGSPTGVVNGLTRFLRTNGQEVQEVLFDEHAAVALERNVARAGALTAHTAYSYAPWGADGDLVRTRISHEELLSDSSGRRSRAQVSFSSVAVEKRGR